MSVKGGAELPADQNAGASGELAGADTNSSNPRNQDRHNPVEKPFLHRRAEIHLPQMAFNGLSENWLMKELGDLHWTLLSQATSVPTDRFVDGQGRRLLTSFTRVRYESDVSLQRYRENEALDFHASMSRFGQTALFSDIDMKGAAGMLRASLMTMFAARVNDRGNILTNSRPKASMLDAIPSLNAMPAFAEAVDSSRTRRGMKKNAGNLTLLGDVTFGHQESSLFDTEYDIEAYNDLNGLGLLYFASYPRIHDICELRYLQDIQERRGIDADWSSAASVIARDIVYFGNCDQHDSIIFSLSECEFISRSRIKLKSILKRKSDGKKISEVLTVKELLPGGDAFHSLWEGEAPSTSVPVSVPSAPAIRDTAPADDGIGPAVSGPPAADPAVAAVEAALIDSLARVIDREAGAIDPDAPLRELNIGSLSAVEFADHFEDAHGVAIDPSWLYGEISVRKLAARIGGRTVVPAASPAASQAAVQTAAQAVAPPRADASPVPASAQREDDRVAIIGMSLRFPGSDDPEEFWRHLVAGDDLVGPPPAGRTELRGILRDSAGGHRPTQGGFLSGIKEFDPLFFKISPREAESMDPQQRILLEEAWRALENAGYRASALRGSLTGVFVGISNNDYDEMLLREDRAAEFYGTTGTTFSVAANRISYFLDLRGPSLAIDTACSSSLVAIHQAVRSIQAGECGLALAGGVNVNVSTRRFRAFGEAGMLSPDGRCKTFDKRANGYVRGEGGAFVLLKPLARALADGDHIHGVVIGSAVNHGGAANTLTTPNPDAQAQLIVDAWTRAGVDPASIGYLEAHGTGTALGDPIEILGVKTAFETLYRNWGTRPGGGAHCGIGSVKTNIGHLESAAGIAGLAKVLLAFQHRMLPATIHFSELNPHIRLDGSPLYIVSEARDWRPAASEAGQASPLRAGLSSFGSGGVNAHVALEAAVPPETPQDGHPDGLQVVVLSAASAAQLRIQARRLASFLAGPAAVARPSEPAEVEAGLRRIVAELRAGADAAGGSLADFGFSPLERAQLAGQVNMAFGASVEAADIDDECSIAGLAERISARLARRDGTSHADRAPPHRLGDIAYTLQVGREPMAHRLAVLAGSVAELVEALDAMASGRDHPGLFVGEAAGPAEAIGWEDGGRCDPAAVAARWVVGHTMDWAALHAGRPRRRVPLPTYPFARETVWIGQDPEAAPAMPPDGVEGWLRPETVGDHPRRFAVTLRGDDPILRDHKVGGAPVLAGAVILELFRRAGHLAEGRPATRIRDLAWLAPLRLSDDGDPREPVRVVVEQTDRGHEAAILADGTDVAFSRCLLFFDDDGADPVVPPLPVAGDPIDPRSCYRHLRRMGIEHGPSYRVLHELRVAGDEAFALLDADLEADGGPAPTAGGDHGPRLVDGAFQAALCMDGEQGGPDRLLPFAVSEIRLMAPLPRRCRVHLLRTLNRPDLRTFTIRLLDEAGNPLMVLRDVTVRGSAAAGRRNPAASPVGEAADGEVMILAPRWNSAPLPLAQPEGMAGPILLAWEPGAAAGRLAAALAETLGAAGPLVELPLSGAAGASDEDGSVMQDLVARLHAHRPGIGTLVYVAEPAPGTDASGIGSAARHARGILLLLRSILRQGGEAPPLRFLHVGAGAAILAALFRSVRAETPKLLGRAVECDPGLDDASAAAALARELFCFQNDPAAIRLTRNDRLVLGLEEIAPPSGGGLFGRHDGVSLITGGAGGAGLHLARALAAAGDRTIVLCGRSAPSPEIDRKLEPIAALGCDIRYFQADVTDRRQFGAMLESVRERIGPLGAVFHAAGVLRDSFVYNKTGRQTDEVLGPKLEGAENLDALTRDDPLALFVLFSSITALTGNIGQADYAVANACLDAFADWRDGLSRRGERRGRTIALNWPLWADGGMSATEAGQAALHALTGSVPLAADTAVRALDRVLSLPLARAAVLSGPAIPIRNALKGFLTEPVPAPAAMPAKRSVMTEQRSLEALIETRLARLLAETTRIAASKIKPTEMLENYGMDSILAMKLTQLLETTFGELSKTLFFEYRTIADLAAHLARNHGETALAAWGGGARPAAAALAMATETRKSAPAKSAPAIRPPTPLAHEAERDDMEIAVIGVAGRYPMARTLDEFWRNLSAGRNCVTEIPEDRWDHRRHYSPVRQPGKSYSKWGGFIDGVDEFDPLFFNISPREAALMDPQERLFLEVAWEALEDAGCPRAALPHEKTGVFVGVMYGEYQLLGAEESLCGDAMSSSSFYASIANRVSYHFNFGGPSMAVDTMCSSSLTAIHLACESLRTGESEAAIAGGVNLSIHPNKYILLSRGGFVSSDGLCRSFGEGGDGYVPGEGVGAVLLKRKSRAIADGDRIYGIIRGTAVNHGGKTNGFTVPNPQAQARLITRAMKRARISPAQVDYIEAHGTGTALGDPIEITALSKAFAELGESRTGLPPCPVGSAKSSIGHLEAAAGIAGITKVLLQMKHRQLPPSLHSKDLNPNINFARTPFVIQRDAAPWEPRRPDGDGRLVAAVSSFGAGGANAHVVIESHRPDIVAAEDASPNVIVLSARSDDRLRALAGRMLDFLSGPDGLAVSMGSLACTLQTGREALEERIAFVADDRDAVCETLRAYLAGDPSGVFRGGAGTSDTGVAALFGGDAGAALLEAAIETRDLERLARLWSFGAEVDWTRLYGADRPARISLPSYPFSRESHWIARRATASVPAPVSTDIDGDAADGLEVLLEKVWRPAATQTATTRTPAGMVLAVLVGDRDVERAKRLFGPGSGVRPVLVVDRAGDGEGFDFRDAGSGDRAGRRILEREPALDGLVDLSDLDRRSGDPAECPFGKIAFLQALLDGARHRRLSVIQVTSRLALRPGDRSGLDGALFAGLIKGLGAEYGNLTVRTVDVGRADVGTADASKDEALSRIVAAELGIGDGPAEVAYRDGLRLTPALSVAPAGRMTPSFAIDPEAVVVITGGTSGIGAQIARRLVEKGVRKLALMGVRPLPPRADWDGALATGATDAQTAARIRHVRDLEAAGARVLTHSGPLTDSAALEGYFSDVRRSLGPIGGVIHCAGVGSGGRPAFIHKTTEDMARVFEPKVAGLATLDRLLSADPLRFFILFSSVSGTVPALAAGMSDYAAANAFMDAYAAHRAVGGAAGGAAVWRSIVWPSWKEVGLGEVTGATYRNLGFRSLLTSEGLALFDKAMAAGNEAQILAARVDGARFSAEALLAPRRQSPPAATPQAAQAARVDQAAVSSGVGSASGIRPGVYDRLKRIFAEELKLDPDRLDPDTRFERYGVDSILLVDLVNRLEQWIGRRLDPTVFLEHPTLGALSRHIERDAPSEAGTETAARDGRDTPAAQVPAGPVSAMPSVVAGSVRVDPPAGSRAVAVVGMACRFPGAPDTDAFWHNLAGGVCSVSEVPPSRWDWRAFHSPHVEAGKTISRWGGFVEGIEEFDPAFFGIAEQDAPQIDPLIRLVLEVGVEAVCHAGYRREELDGRRVGVFMGARAANYGDRIATPSKNSIIGIGQNFIAAHLAQFYNLRGPNLVVDTACSSSLVSVHLACRALLDGDADMALAGGVDCLLDETYHLILSEARALSPDGRCHTFDEGANGFVPGEGCGIVVLKRLADAVAQGDRVLAVIEGTAVNNDGRTMGITTPNPDAQKEVIREALAVSGVQPGAVSYVEAHGTGTMIGDPMEIRSLSAVFGEAGVAAGGCAVGSVKSNIGHLLSAAGIASLIKVVLALGHRRIPPTVNCRTPNPRIGFDKTPFHPNLALSDWAPRGGVCRAGISAFGFGGTNAHAILREGGQAGGRPALPPPRFQRKRHWLPPRAAAVPGGTPSAVRRAAPLALTAVSAAADREWIATTTLGGDDPILRNHHVHGVAILPGVALIDLVCRAMALWGVDPARLTLTRILFEQPIAIDGDGRRSIEVRIDRGADPHGVVVRSRDADAGAAAEWRLHLTSEARIGDEPQPPRRQDLAALEAGAVRTVDLDAAYERARGVSILHRAFMKGTGRIHELPVGALADIALESSAAVHAGDFHAHPALLDSATLVPFHRQSDPGQETPFIPMYVDQFRIVRPLPERVRVWVRTTEGHAADRDVLYSSLDFHDDQGNLLCEMSGLATKRIRSSADIRRLVAAPQPSLSAAAPAPAVTETAAPARTRGETGRADIERDLRALVAPLLACAPDAIAADTGFYELGLDSVALLEVARRIEQRLGRRIFPTLLFEYNTLRQLADHLDAEFGADWLGGGERGQPLPDALPPAAPLPDATPPAGMLAVEVGWSDEPLASAAPGSGGPLLVVTGDDDRFAALARLAGSEPIRVRPAGRFRVVDDRTYELCVTERDDHRQLWQALRQRGGEVDRILYLAPPSGPAHDPAADAERTLLALTALCQAVLAERVPRPVRLVYVYDESGRGSLCDAALEGFVQTLRRETDQIVPGLVALAPGSAKDGSAPESWVRPVLAELSAPAWAEGRAPVVRYVGARRQVRRLTVADRSAPVPGLQAPVPATLAGGEPPVWLITGGLGGLGLIFAEELARAGRCRLVLCGRREPDAAGRGSIARLEALGAEILWVGADVTRRDEVRELVAAARRRFGAIHGVIHAAGVVKDGLVVTKTASGMAGVLAPKLDGTLLLDSFTRNEPLEHFVLFSSTAAVLGNIGQSDYAFANAFMDAFALWREDERRAGRRAGRTVSVNWPLWRSGGMRAEPASLAALAAETGLSPLATANGLQAFRDLLRGDRARMLVLEGDREALSRSFGIADPRAVPVPAAGPAPIPAATPKPDDGEETYAIVGVAGRYPKAPDLASFWKNLLAGRDCIEEIPAGRWDNARFFDGAEPKPGKTYAKWGGFLDGVDAFDPLMFSISPADAELMDPQERLFLETVWELLEDAGRSAAAMRREKVGVFVGAMWNQYPWFGIEEAMKGNPVQPVSFSASIANRVSYFFDFRGPSLSVDTMCSSSLTAIHLACDSIRRGECTQAIAGGVNLILHPAKYVFLSQGRMLSTDGRCRAFGRDGDGYVPGEGVGAILIKPLSAAVAQGDHIHAVIRGSALNHGGRASGYTVPSVEAQAEVIRAAVRRSGVDPSTIGYIEAHGTGTSLGDPIEIRGLADGLGARDGGPRSIGSVKANMGHLEAAAGIASVTKVLLQMRHRTLVPSIHSDDLNPHIDFTDAPVAVQRAVQPWRGMPADGRDAAILRAGVSSFGAGGANAHVILESCAPEPEPQAGPAPRPELIVLSARSTDALRAMAGRLSAHIGQPAAAERVVALRDAVAALTGMAPLEIDAGEPLSDYGVGPVGWSRLAESVADRFGVALSAGDLAAAATIDAIAARIGDLPGASGEGGGRPPALGPMAFTLQVGRTAFAERMAFVARSVPEAAAVLRAFAGGDRPPGVIAGRAGDHAAAGGSATAAAFPNGEMPDWETVARRWVAGEAVAWESFHAPAARRRVPLPTYPFQRKRYWLPVAPMPAAVHAATPAATGPERRSADPGVAAFAPVWQSVPAVPAGERQRRLDARREGGARALVVCRDAGALDVFTRELAAAGGSVLRVRGVTAGPKAARRSDTLDAVRWDSAEDWAGLFGRLAEAGDMPDQLFLLQTDGDPTPSDTTSGAAMEAVARFWFGFARAVMLHATAPVSGVYLCPAGAEGPGLRDMAVLPLLKSVGWESRDVRLRFVAIEGDGFDGALWCRHALDEWAAGTEDGDDILHAAGGRLARRFVRAAGGPQDGPARLRRGGAYLITGGMGQLGRRLAEMLVRRFDARVYLAGRAPFDREIGAALSAMSHGTAGRAFYRPTDIADAAAVQALVEDIVAEHGRLDGVLHLARAVEDGVILRKRPDSVDRVLRAKIRGTLVLDAATAGQPLDFFLMFSSMAGLFGLRGSADYAYACGFQNGFAAWRAGEVAAGRRSGTSRALCWSQWEHDPHSNPDRDAQFEKNGFRLIDMETGFDAMLGALGAAEPALAIVRGEPSRLDGLMDERTLRGLFAPSAPAPAPVPASAAPLTAAPPAHGEPEEDDAGIAGRIARLSDAELLELLAKLEDEPVVGQPSGRPSAEPSHRMPAARVAAPAMPAAAVVESPVHVTAPVRASGSGDAGATLRRIMREVLKLDDETVDFSRPFQDYGVDSVSAVQMAVRLETALGTDVPARLLAAHAKPEDLLREVGGQPLGLRGELAQT